MSDEPIRIKRYPNRRFYSSHTSRYVSLPEIEQMIQGGAIVEIVDSQTGEDITSSILVQIIAEKHPDKIAMFPTLMLHAMLGANEVMTEFLQTYFRNAQTSLEYLQKHGAVGSLEQPMHWMKPWFDLWSIQDIAKRAPNAPDKATSDESAEIAERIAMIEKRIAELEVGKR